ncbi:MAG: hypothetical protein WBA51_12870 [Erythrobacter sp.]
MTQELYAIVTRLRDARLVRYILASAGALAGDVGSFLAFWVSPPHLHPRWAILWAFWRIG